MGWLLVLMAVAATALGWWRLRRGMGRQRRLMVLCRRAGLGFAPLDLFPDTAWLPFPMFGHVQHGTENVVWERSTGAAVRAFDFWYTDPAEEGKAGARRRFTCAAVPSGSRARAYGSRLGTSLAGSLRPSASTRSDWSSRSSIADSWCRPRMPGSPSHSSTSG